MVAWPESLVAAPNSNVSFQCNATGIPDPVITWTKEGGDLPRGHSVEAGVLNLTRLVNLDDGRYICTATNAAGALGVSVQLTVEGLLVLVLNKLAICSKPHAIAAFGNVLSHYRLLLL